MRDDRRTHQYAALNCHNAARLTLQYAWRAKAEAAVCQAAAETGPAEAAGAPLPEVGAGVDDQIAGEAGRENPNCAGEKRRRVRQPRRPPRSGDFE